MKNNITIAQETINILKAKKYKSPNGKIVDISQEMACAKYHTEIYAQEKIDKLTLQRTIINNPTIEVVNERTNEAAKRLLDYGKSNIAILNFANGCNPGGSFLEGSTAQEETLCKCSSLYVCLNSKFSYYVKNIQESPIYYNNDILYSADVPFFRTDDMQLVEEPYLLSVITAPAPNLYNEKNPNQDLLQEIIPKRIENILKVACLNGHKTIVLGAWGCGAFKNDPVFIASSFKKVVNEMKCFKHICYAVYDTKNEQPMYNVFKKTMFE